MNDCGAKQKAENCSSSDTRCVTESFEYKIIFDIKRTGKDVSLKATAIRNWGKRYAHKPTERHVKRHAVNEIYATLASFPRPASSLWCHAHLWYFYQLSREDDLSGRAASVTECE